MRISFILYKCERAPPFSDEYLTNGTLERELNIQKVLGVIICAEKDERLQNRLIKILSKYYSVWFTLVKNKPRDFPIKLEMKFYP